jgi:hypothetical protein
MVLGRRLLLQADECSKRINGWLRVDEYLI